MEHTECNFCCVTDQIVRASFIQTIAWKMEPRSGLKTAAGTSVQAIFSLACCSIVVFIE
jgi:hypothetical protein